MRITIKYDGYVNSLSTRGFNLVLGIEILTIDHFQLFLGFFGTPCIDRSRIHCSPSLVTVAASDKLKFVFDIQRGKNPDCYKFANVGPIIKHSKGTFAKESITA